MVLDQLVLAALLTRAPIAPAQAWYVSEPVPISGAPFAPVEHEVRDAPPIAYTDRFELRRPGRTYQNRR